MLHEISDSAFDDCYSLKEIEIPSSVKYLKSKCFMSTGIMKILLDEIMELGENCFQNCTSLNSLSINSLKNISSHSFDGCINLASIVLPFDLEYLGTNSFSRTSIVNLTIPFNVKWMDQKCFGKCKELKTISISSQNLSEIKSDSFSECSNIQYVIYCGSSSIKNECGFPITAIVYVSSSYKETVFCGIIPFQWLNKDCVIVYPTEVFSISVGELPIHLNVIVPVITFSSDNDDCAEGGKL